MRARCLRLVLPGVLLAAAAAAPGRSCPETAPPASRAPTARPAAPPQSGPGAAHLSAGGLRGTGILILDPRDSPDAVRERVRQFVLEVRANVPPELRQEELHRQIDAVLRSDPSASKDLPQLSFTFPPGMTADRLKGYMENTPSARDSRRVCPRACPVAAMFRDGIHIHLTRPAGGPGDSVLAIELERGSSASPAADSEEARLAETRRRRQSLLDRYPEMGYERRPAGQIFGVRVYIGEPLTPEEAKPPEP